MREFLGFKSTCPGLRRDGGLGVLEALVDIGSRFAKEAGGGRAANDTSEVGVPLREVVAVFEVPPGSGGRCLVSTKALIFSILRYHDVARPWL